MNPIELHDLRKNYGDKPVLRGLDMQIAPGELVGFVGPNGAGKTTCLRILLGLLRHDGGRARVLGMDPGVDGVRIREHCCYLPGETSLYHGMRGKEFLRFALGFYPRQQEDIRLDLIEGFGLPLQKRIRTYSAGMKQKLALMATLIPDVELYVLDEPDRALDATTRFFVRDLLDKLHAKGKTILLSSHHLREVESLTDRLMFIMEGRILDDARVDAARRALLRQVRLKVAAGTALPGGATELQRDLDGTLHMAPDGDPLTWLAGVPAQGLVSAEVGVVHLEDLYRLLVTEQES